MISLMPPSMVLTKKAAPIKPAMSRPFQKALKLPATRPERIVKEAPPSRDAVTISCTCLECELVKTLVNSGIRTAANVPQLMMTASFHHRPGIAIDRPGIASDISPMSSQLIPNEVEMHRIDAIQISRVRGSSKSNSFRPRYLLSEMPWLTK